MPLTGAVSAGTWRDLCPEADLRDGMTEPEFWQHVLQGAILPEYQEDDPDGLYYDGPDVDVALSQQPCPTCGSSAACGYDSEGRPMIHTTDPED